MRIFLFWRATILLFTIFTIQVAASQTRTPIAKDWHHQNRQDTQAWGVSTIDAYQWLNQENIKLKPIVVAVIDADLDVNHEDLKEQLWNNPKPNTRAYPGSVNGWNFLGTKDGRLITKVGMEAFREYKRLRPKYEGKVRTDFSDASDLEEFDYFQQVRRDAKIQGFLNFFPYVQMTYDAFRTTDSLVLLASTDYSAIKLSEVGGVKNQDTVLQQYIDAALRSSYKYSQDALWSEIYANQKQEYLTTVNRIKSLDNTSNPRDSIGDDLFNIKDRYYGNGQLVDTTSFHGTFVAGLIAAQRNNGIGIDGVAENALLMGVRAVPDGDEFDKDVALSIRYAVDHGAKIINMSFGKYYSPHSKWVTDAMHYALKKNVLLVQAAGNDKKDLNVVTNYPKAPKNLRKKEDAYLLVGASTMKGVAASFSNFGNEKVDFFAPGDKVTSTKTGNLYATESGTSFSAPIVSGIAAVLWGAYPKLKAYEIAAIIKQSAARNMNESLADMAIVPGVVNLRDALEIAKQYVEKK